MKNIFILVASVFIFGNKNKLFLNNGAHEKGSILPAIWGLYYFTNGSTKDSSGHNHDIVLLNGAHFGTDRQGRPNNALELDGINDLALIPSGRDFPSGDFTICFYMFAERASGRLLNKANYYTAKGASITFGFFDDVGLNRLSYGITQDKNICSNYGDMYNSSVLNPNKPIFAGRWYHLAIQFEEGKQKIYCDGKLLISTIVPDKTYATCTSAPIYLGVWWKEDLRAFRGKIDNLRIYTRALNAEQISFLYKHNR